ncbi:hypothetical protein BGY98DRAFT_1098405 [Russula aff. rugulosa BPL654]|nr:hypothetical protein BGY98DRAFT_1098405 [Russula aff. rugulosa BPL654]
MPSILSRLLGRKKSQEPESLADKPGYSPLLEGKFEVVSPTVSPSAAFFTDPGAAQIRGVERPKDKESPLHVFRARSRPSSDLSTVEKVEKPAHNVPHLSLNLPVIKERGRALDVVFESGSDALALLNETTIRERRLTLMKPSLSCVHVPKSSWNVTLGVMHPHWYSASPEVQRRLISLYILSLAPTVPNDATSPTSPTAPATFEYELQYTCSPHDSAAILRWGLRHLKLTAIVSVKSLVIGHASTAHIELLLATLDIISSLSARSEANGSSGSKLSKFFGLWLLTCGESTESDNWSTFYDRWDRAGRILEHLFLARIRNDAHGLPRRLTDLVEHYPYDHVDAPRDADALRAQSTSESATPEDAGLWDAIKKASLTLDAAESSSDAALAEPIPVFSNVFSDETIRLLSLIPVDVSDKDKPAPSFILQSPISTGRPRSFSLPDTPLSPVQSDRGRPPPSRPAHVVPSLTASNSTAPTTASPDTPADWLQFSSNGFGTIPGLGDLAEKLWDNDVEVTVPPAAPLSRKSSRRAQSRHSRHSSLDSARTPVAPLPTIPAILISKTTLVAKVKLDEAFIDFWADSLLDPVLKHSPRFVLCQLKPSSLASTSASPTPAWLVIEQRLVPVVPVAPPVKEEAEVTIPPARPRASSPRPESSRLSSAFSIASKRFTFFTGGSSEPKSPREKTTRLPHVGEFGEVSKGRGDGPTEAAAKGSVNQGVASVPMTVGATVLAVAGTATASVAATQEKITQKPKDDGLPVGTAETAPSELASISAPKADEIRKDELLHSTATQNGLAHDDEGQYERKSETVRAQGSAGPDTLVSSTVTSEPVKAETEPLVSRAELEIAQSEPTFVPAIPLAGISDSPHPQAKAVSEPSVVPVVEGATSAEETVTAPVVPSKSAELPATEPTPVPVPPAAAIEEPVVDDVAAAQEAEPDLVVEVKATEQDLPADEVAPDAEPTHTFELVPAPTDEAVTVSEIPRAIPEAALPEGRVGELPTSDAAPVPAFEKTVPEEDKATMREVQVATSADSEPVVVAELETVPTDEAAPANQASPVDEGQVAESVEAVETTGPLEEPAEVVGEPVIKEEAQPAAIFQRDDSILEESNDMEATATESATEPHPVASDTAFPAVEKADSAADQAAPEASASNDEPDVEHAVIVTQPIEESLPTAVTPEVQDAIIEEHPTAEEINPIPEASTTTESAVAENIPLVEPTTSSEVSPPEVLEEPVTEAAPEPTTIAHDGSAEPVVDHAEQVNAEATVSMDGNESTTSPIDEVSMPKANQHPSWSKPAPPETKYRRNPAPAAHETESLTEESAPAATETLMPAPVTEAEEPAPDEATTPEAAETAMEAPVSVPAESDPEEAPPALPTPPKQTQSATDPTPLPEESAPTTEAAVPETSVPDEPGPVVEEDSHVVEQDGPVVEGNDPIVEQDDPVVEQDEPVLEEHSPVVEEHPPVLEEHPPVLEEHTPVVEEPPVLEEHPPVVEEDPPIVEEQPPVLEERPPVVEEHPPVLEEHTPVEEQPPVLEDIHPLLRRTHPLLKSNLPFSRNAHPLLRNIHQFSRSILPLLRSNPLFLRNIHPFEEDPPVVEEQPPFSRNAHPLLRNIHQGSAHVEQPPVVEEQPPVLEEDPPVLEENPVVKRDDLVLEEDDPVVEEDEPAAPEPTVENSAPLPEDLATTESAAPNETPVESPEHDEEGLPTSEPPAVVTEETAPSTEDKAGLEGTVEVDPVVEESVLLEEQVAQEPPISSGVDTATASEPEAPSAAAADSTSSETTGAADDTSW